jgi:hypothetical protein
MVLYGNSTFVDKAQASDLLFTDVSLLFFEGYVE